MLLSTAGVCSSGIAAVTVGGAPAAPPHVFNGTALVLDYGALPAPSAAAAAATDSDVSTAADSLAVHITFASAAPPPPPRHAAPSAAGRRARGGPDDVPAGAALRLRASR